MKYWYITKLRNFIKNLHIGRIYILFIRKKRLRINIILSGQSIIKNIWFLLQCGVEKEK
jgi:hypothetical protein